MKIKEVEQLLDVTRDTVRFYEKEGLLNVKRNNKYRDYSKEDIAQLKRIIVLRKLGISIENIKNILLNNYSMQPIIENNIIELENQIEKLNGALNVSRELTKNKTELSDFDEEIYWDKINAKEKSGEKFKDILMDYLAFETSTIEDALKRVFFLDLKRLKKKYGIIVACSILLLTCVIRGLSSKFIRHSTFWNGFLYPFIIILIASMILLPLYFINKKYPKFGSVLAKILLYICIGLFALFAVVIIIGILNLFFHFY